MPPQAMDVTAALAFLQKAASTDGSSVYEHLTGMLAKASRVPAVVGWQSGVAAGCKQGSAWARGEQAS